MKFALKSIIAATAFVAMGAASAAPITLDQGAEVTSGNKIFSGLTGSGTLKFSTALVGALNSGGINVTEVAPATAIIERRANGQYKSVSASAPVTSLSAEHSGGTVAVTSVSTQGGALQTAEEDPEGFASTGGSLSITNLRVDLTSKKVFATLVGGNGVGTVNDLHLWDIANIEGATSFADSPDGTTTSVNALTGLSINKPAFDLFAQSLGLTQAGIVALETVSDFGRIDSSISVTVTTVPEATSAMYTLMGVGLVGLLASRRRAAK